MTSEEMISLGAKLIALSEWCEGMADDLAERVAMRTSVEAGMSASGRHGAFLPDDYDLVELAADHYLGLVEREVEVIRVAAKAREELAHPEELEAFA